MQFLGRRGCELEEEGTFEEGGELMEKDLKLLVKRCGGWRKREKENEERGK